MTTTVSGLIYAGIMGITIVVLDLLFFRHHLWPRLAVNVGIVLIFAAFYFRFFRRP